MRAELLWHPVKWLILVALPSSDPAGPPHPFWRCAPPPPYRGRLSPRGKALALLLHRLRCVHLEHRQNVVDIIDSQNAGTRAILDYLCNEKIASLQSENNDLRRAASQDRQSALLTTAMTAQTQQLINAINPAAIPAYVVPNPNAYYNACGCNNGCC